MEQQGGVTAAQRRPDTTRFGLDSDEWGPAPGPAAEQPPYDPEWWLREAEAPPGGSASYEPHRQPAGHAAAHGRTDTGNRLLLTILFWFGLAASVEVWWLNNPAHSISGTGPVLIAAGQITGMVGGYVLLAQVLMMSRVAWLEQWFGAHGLLIWHRSLGGFLVVLIPAHAVFTIFGYAAAADVAATHETWTMLTTYEDMISAFVATGILVAIGVLAIRAVRRLLPYELWYFLHLTSYLVLLLGYGHQFAVGADLLRGGFARWYWTSLYVFVVACLVWGRVLEPLWLNLRHHFRVVAVVDEAPDMVSIYVGGRHLDRLEARAGQYFRWRFLTRGNWWQAHPFSLSAAPNSEWLRLTVKVVGDHTRGLRNLKPGDRVYAEGPSGAFTADRRVRPGALLIAGGSGIAPIRALLEDLPAGTVVLYRASTADDLVFRDELDSLAVEKRAQVWYVLGARDDPGPRYLFTPAGLRELVPDVRRRDVYLCGPDGLIATSLAVLRRLRVPKRQIHLDPFEF
ncbi:ferric reductase-like transmembrane domain-containing protein [Planosporangium sp. 12N6]|uniref:ferredoxin reductase family protein n=1 Tax=Planosporangium spinosum TaxID=3402278 RepID=UPI003CEEE4B1